MLCWSLSLFFTFSLLFIFGDSLTAPGVYLLSKGLGPPSLEPAGAGPASFSCRFIENCHRWSGGAALNCVRYVMAKCPFRLYLLKHETDLGDFLEALHSLPSTVTSVRTGWLFILSRTLHSSSWLCIFVLPFRSHFFSFKCDTCLSQFCISLLF